MYLIHIVERARRIQRFVGGGKQEFMGSEMIQDSVLRNLEVIGEAVKNLQDSTRAADPTIPWRRMAGLRDVLIHAYPRVDLATVWSICTVDLPPAARQIEDILRGRGVDLSNLQ